MDLKNKGGAKEATRRRLSYSIEQDKNSSYPGQKGDNNAQTVCPRKQHLLRHAQNKPEHKNVYIFQNQVSHHFKNAKYTKLTPYSHHNISYPHKTHLQ